MELVKWQRLEAYMYVKIVDMKHLNGWGNVQNVIIGIL